MVVIVNGQEANWVSQGLTVGELRQEVGMWARNHGHAVAEVRLDGELVEDPMDPNQSGARDGVVEIMTSDMVNLIGNLAADTADYLSRLTAGLTSAADLIYSGRETEGIEQFQACLDGLDWVYRAARLTNQASSLWCEQAPKMLEMSRAEAVLRDLEAALRERDILLLADLVQSSLCPTLEEWRKALAG